MSDIAEERSGDWRRRIVGDSTFGAPELGVAREVRGVSETRRSVCVLLVASCLQLKIVQASRARMYDA